MKPVKSPPVPAPKASDQSLNETRPGLVPGGDDLAMPHERDQATDMTPEATDPVVEQAAKDLKRGLKDTSNGPEMDKAYDKLKP